jgi:Relaxase/Mobilisation nuclease domain
LNARLSLGKGITGSLAYVMGQGNDPVTKKRLELGEGEKSRAEILGGQNFGFEIDSADRLDIARRLMEWSALPDNQASRGKKCVNDCLHVSLSWEKGQEPDKAEMAEAARSFLKSVGMEHARAVFVAHDDTAHRHVHVVASRIDPASCKTISDSDMRIKSQTWALHWERDHNQRSQNESRQARHKIIDAIEARDIPAIVENLTARSPTFTARELDNALAYGKLDKKERAAFRAEILAHQNIVGLREETQGPVTRYTTRAVLAAEMALQRNAAILAERGRHGLSDDRICKHATMLCYET